MDAVSPTPPETGPSCEIHSISESHCTSICLRLQISVLTSSWEGRAHWSFIKANELQIQSSQYLKSAHITFWLDAHNGITHSWNEDFPLQWFVSLCLKQKQAVPVQPIKCQMTGTIIPGWLQNKSMDSLLALIQTLFNNSKEEDRWDHSSDRQVCVCVSVH